jgi:hypothetical protein
MPNFLTEFAGDAWDAITGAVGGAVDLAGSTLDATVRGTQIATGTTSIDDSSLGQSQYDFTSRVFPADLGNEDTAHYMVININVPVRSGQIRSAFTNATNFQTLLPNEASKVDVLRFGQGVENFGGASRGVFSVPRFTRRIAESIALYMPSPLTYTSMNQYEDISMTALAGNIGMAGAGIVGAGIGAFIGGRGGPAGAIAGAATGSSLASSLASAAGDVVGTASTLTGYPINPRVEVLFSTTPQRQFMFEVLLAPRNEKESQTIEEIIKTLRFHAAPEIDQQTLGLTFIPPAEFDITFYNKGNHNDHLPMINTCVLERIDVDYAPFDGKYTTFKNGYPIGVRLSLGFREVEIVHKLRVLQGF